MGTPRLTVGRVMLDDLRGQTVLRLGLMGHLPAVGLTNVFTYWLSLDLKVLNFYSGDPFKTWGAWARRKGLIDVDVSSAEFEDYMRRIEVIPGPPELFEP